MGTSENSVLETKNPLGQGDPGSPISTWLVVCSSETECLKLLKGTPRGETSLKYKSDSFASFSLLKVVDSTQVTSGTSKNGVAIPILSMLKSFCKRFTSPGVPTPPCTVINGV